MYPYLQLLRLEMKRASRKRRFGIIELKNISLRLLFGYLIAHCLLIVLTSLHTTKQKQALSRAATLTIAVILVKYLKNVCNVDSEVLHFIESADFKTANLLKNKQDLWTGSFSSCYKLFWKTKLTCGIL